MKLNAKIMHSTLRFDVTFIPSLLILVARFLSLPYSLPAHFTLLTLVLMQRYQLR
jgi:hypothetical protein